MIRENKELSDLPLVSVIVLAYNSAQYITETLESIKAQTYRNIELIITDDCSSDSTINICNSWIKRNAANFTATEFITTQNNSGIPANCNRGAKIAKGVWLKFLAADDVLTIDSIESFIRYSHKYPVAEVIISRQHSFIESEGIKAFLNFRPELSPRNKAFYEEDSTVEVQYDFLLKRIVLIAGPAYFIKSSLLSDLGYFSERYRLLEDYPIFLKILESGRRIYYLNKVTVEYRVHNNAVSHSGYGGVIYPKYYKDMFSFLMEHNFKRLSFLYKTDLLLEYLLYKVIVFTGNRGKFLLSINDNLRKLLPVHVVFWLNKKR
jgi:GT2 family glycosyltransferase